MEMQYDLLEDKTWFLLCKTQSCDETKLHANDTEWAGGNNNKSNLPNLYDMMIGEKLNVFHSVVEVDSF